VLHPGTTPAVGPNDLAPLFPMASSSRKVTQEREVEIPEPVRDVVPPVAALSAYRARASRRRCRRRHASTTSTRRFAPEVKAEHRRAAAFYNKQAA